MTTFVFANNVNTTLATAISPTATTIALASSTNLPTITPGDYFPLTLNDKLTGNVYEIVYVTAITGASLTVIRGQEGTTAQSWIVGDYAYGAFTAGSVLTTNNNYIVNPMTAAGDIIVGGASGAATRLAPATDGYVLTLATGTPTWAAPASSGVAANTANTWTAPQAFSEAITVLDGTAAQNPVTLNQASNGSLSPTFKSITTIDPLNLTFEEVQNAVGYNLGAGVWAGGYIWGGDTPPGDVVNLPNKNGYIFQFVGHSPPQIAQLPTGPAATSGSANFRIGVQAGSISAPSILKAPSGGYFYLPGSPTQLLFRQPSEYAEIFANENNQYGLQGGTWGVFNLANYFFALQTFTQGIAPSASFTSNSATLTGTTAGAITSSMPEQGVAKKFVAYANGYENDTSTAQTITFPTAFSNPPEVTTNTSGLTVATSKTELTITAPNNTTLYSGLIIVEGI